MALNQQIQAVQAPLSPGAAGKRLSGRNSSQERLLVDEIDDDPNRIVQVVENAQLQVIDENLMDQGPELKRRRNALEPIQYDSVCDWIVNTGIWNF